MVMLLNDDRIHVDLGFGMDDPNHTVEGVYASSRPPRPRFPPSAMPSSTRRGWLTGGTCSLRSNTTQLGVASGSENIPFEPETDNSGEGKPRGNRRLQGNNRLR